MRSLFRLQQQTADRQQRDGEQKRRQHDRREFPGRDVEIGVKIEILRIAEGRQHAAEIRGDVLQDKDIRHVPLLFCDGEGKVAERQKGDERHVIRDEHAAEKGDVNERKREHAQIPVRRTMRRAKMEKNLISRSAQTTASVRKQAAKRSPVEIAEIFRVRRNEHARHDRRRCRRTEHGVFLQEPFQLFHRKHTLSFAAYWAIIRRNHTFFK